MQSHRRLGHDHGGVCRFALDLQLDRLKHLALEAGNHGAAIQAEQTRGKVAGHHIDRVMEIPADPVETLREIARTQPDVAASLAAAHGIEWKADEGATKH